MGTNCSKPTESLDLRDEITRRRYYLNIKDKNGDRNELAQENYDITQKSLVGFGHIQKTNIFHQIPKGKF